MRNRPMMAAWLVLWVAAWALACIHLGLLGAVAWAWFRLAKQKTQHLEKRPIECTVLVCMHNEALNAEHCLDSILAQTYPNFGVVVVNDRSTDITGSILEFYQKKHENLKVLSIGETPQGWAPKKWAVWQGLQHARTDIVALTDADCRPGPHWLSQMLAPFHRPEVEFVLGFGPYAPKPGLLNALVRHETWQTALLYGAAARLWKPYMGVGRSLAYRKRVFQGANPFAGTQHRASGDDDLLVAKFATRQNSALATHPASWAPSQQPNGWPKWVSQKSRHVSSGAAYPWPVLAALGLHAWSLAGVWALAGTSIACACYANEPTYAVGLLPLGLRWVLLAAVRPLLPIGPKLAWLPTADALYTLYLLVFPVLALSTKPTWRR